MPAFDKSVTDSSEANDFRDFKAGMPAGVRQRYSNHLRTFIYRYTGSSSYASSQVDEIFLKINEDERHIGSIDMLCNYLDELAKTVVLSYLMVNILVRLKLKNAEVMNFAEFESRFKFLLEAAIANSLTDEQQEVYKKLFYEQLSPDAAAEELNRAIQLVEVYSLEAERKLSDHFEEDCFPILFAYFLKPPRPTETPLDGIHAYPDEPNIS